jgi:hypothetical protein
MPRSLCVGILALVVLAPFSGFGVTGSPPTSAQFQAQPLAALPQVVLPVTDVGAELAADSKVSGPAPLRFAVSRPVQLSPASDGTWEEVAGGRLWRLRVVSSGATDLNFGFTSFWLPEGATLHVMSETENYYQGPYTAADNQEYRQLWTPVVPGEAAVVELFVPSTAEQPPELALSHVGTGYRDMFRGAKGGTTGTPKAETCEIDVVCPQGVPWTNEIRSVCRISISGTDLCSASLLMDAAGDFRPFLLSANHCAITPSSAPTIVAYWNYQSPSCGQHGLGGSLAQNQSGAVFRAAKADVDFALVELNSLPSPSFNVFYAGWDRTGTPASGAVGIHHPNGDGKCISFSSNPLLTVDNCIGTGGSSSGTHWQVTWSQGVTEPGSSGSAIFDPTSHRVLGTLSGGGSACTTPFDPDCYGKFAVAWNLGTSPSTRLSDWLDPANTGVTVLTGATSVPATVINAAGTSLVSENCYPGNGVIDPGETVTVAFMLKNAGTLAASNLVATLQATGGVTSPSAPQSYGLLTAYSTNVSRSFSFTASGNCGGSITPVLKLQDGTRNLGTVSFTIGLGKGIVTFTQNFDSVTAPALPSGWTSPSSFWTTSTAQRDTAPNSAFTADPASISDRQLVSPAIAITTPTSLVSFRHWFDLEDGFDGGILEISVGGGPFLDILAAGGSFVSGGYNGTIDFNYGNPLAGSAAWTGTSGGFQAVVANLPPAVAGQSIRLRWRLGSDSSNGGTGWFVDTVSIIDGYTCCSGTAASPTLSGLSFSPTGGFRFNVTGSPAYPYAVERSTNYVDWTRMVTNASPYTFADTNAAALPRRFYRAVFQP